MQRASLVGVAVVLIALITLERAADAKGGGIIVPPMRVELGALFPVIGGEAVEPATEVLIGAHWTAISWRPTKIARSFKNLATDASSFVMPSKKPSRMAK